MKSLPSSFCLSLICASTLPIACLSAMAQGASSQSAGSQSSGSSLSQSSNTSVAPGQAPVQTTAPSSTFNRANKDFKYRKRFIAPTSDLYNRIDYPSMQSSRDSLMLPNYEPGYGKGPPGPSAARPPVTYQPKNSTEPQEALKAQAQSLNSSGSARRPMVSREGLSPPPPPANNQLLPSSLTRQNAPNLSQARPLPVTNTTPLSAAHIAQVKSQAETLVRSGHLAEAQDVLVKVVQNHPHEPVLRAQLSNISLERARFYAKQGSSQQAATQARLAIAYGSAYSSTSESATSLLAANLAKTGIDPRNADARANLGASLLAANSPLESEIEFRQAIKLRPQPDFYIGAGNAAMQSGNRTSAKLDFQKALELNPNSQAALSSLGQVRYQMRDYIGANADLTRALVMNGQDTVAAQTLVDLWQRQVGSRPDDASSHLGLARAYQVTGDLDSARKEYKTVVKIDPNHPNLPAARQSFKLALAKREAYRSFDMAHSFESQGQLPSAYQKASDAVELYPSDNDYQSYKAQLAGKLQAAGMPVYAASGQAMQSLSLLMQGEQPPAANLPTAQAMGLTSGMYAGLNSGMTNAMTGAPSALAQGVQGAQSSPQSAMAADNMYKPLSTDAHVTSMTGFLASLRNFTMQQQAQQDSSGGALSALAGSAPSGLPGGLGGLGSTGGALASVPGFAPSNPLPTSLDQGQLIAQGAQAQALMQANAPVAGGGPVTASSALQAAAAALANTAGINAMGAGGLAAGNAANSVGLGSVGNVASASSGGLAAGMMGAAGGGTSSGFFGGLSSALGGGSGTSFGANYTNPALAAQAQQMAQPPVAPTAANLGVSNNMAAMALGLGSNATPTMASTMIGGLGNVASYLRKNAQTQATGNVMPQNGGQSNYGGQNSYGGQTTYGLTQGGNFNTQQTMPTTVTQRVINGPSGNNTPEPSNVAWPQPQPLPDAAEGAVAQAMPLNGGATASSAGVAAASAVFGTDPTSAATAASLAPPIMSAGQNQLQNSFQAQMQNAGQNNLAGMVGAPQLRSLIPPGAIKLYLTGVKAGKSDVDLQVSLRNDSPVPLKIPSGIKALVRASGQPVKQAKISFAAKVVNSGATITGIIKVPGKSLDPTADVVIPTGDLTKGAIADIHLSVPISAR